MSCTGRIVTGERTGSMKPQIIQKDGKNEFVVITYDEYLQIQESLEDLDDLKTLREAKTAAEGEELVSLDSVREDLLKG